MSQLLRTEKLNLDSELGCRLKELLLMFELKEYLKQHASSVETALDARMPVATQRPSSLHSAMRYSTFSGGKRLRPALCIAAAEACGGSPEDAMAPAMAIELLHTYTLVHDDLPSMDDDDMRRGKPTLHVKYDLPTAILAGDALQALSFEVLTSVHANVAYEPHMFVAELAAAAGSLGVAGGQAEDIAGADDGTTEEAVEFVHRHKTARLFQCAVRMGAMSAGADAKQLTAMSDYGMDLGIAFQITDDILDEITDDGDELQTARADGLSCLAIYDRDKAQEIATDLIAAAISTLSTFGEHAEPLRAIAEYVIRREH